MGLRASRRNLSEKSRSLFRGFPKLGYQFGGPIVRTVVFWGLYWGPLI